MAVGFARYSQDRSFVVLSENRRVVLVMAAGSIVGSFIGGRLLGFAMFVFIPAYAGRSRTHHDQLHAGMCNVNFDVRPATTEVAGSVLMSEAVAAL
jgi:hypothetical protein